MSPSAEPTSRGSLRKNFHAFQRLALLVAHYLPAALAQLFGDLRVWAITEHERRQTKSRGRRAWLVAPRVKRGQKVRTILK